MAHIPPQGTESDRNRGSYHHTSQTPIAIKAIEAAGPTRFT